MLALVILIPFVLIPVLIGLRIALRLRPLASGSLVAAALAAAFALTLSALPSISETGPVTLGIPWVPELGLTLSLYVDGLALLFMLLVTGIGTAVMFYAGTYFDDDAKAARFLAYMLAFTGSMLALVTAGNILTLFIAWELTSITSFLLIGFYGKETGARRGASQALVITGGGGLALLAGLLVLGSAAGSMELPDILASGDVLRAHPWYTGIVVLILAGAFTKSAQFPFHFWLPGAMSAPSPASAFLHSATMVKAGIYLLARMTPVLGDTPLWTNGLLLFGLLTMAIGVVLSLGQRDLKGMLAYTTISQLGALVALIGLPGGEGLRAAYVGIIAHGLYKCALFLVAGAVDHAAGTRDIDKLGGMRRQLPGFAVVTAIAVLSMSGVPPLLGFVSKELLIEAAEIDLIPLIVVVSSAALMVALGLRFFWDVFMRPAPAHDDHAAHGHDLPRLMVVGPGLLAAASIGFGLGVTPLLKPLIQTAVGAPISLYLFPPYGLPLAFWLSMLALAAGTIVFLTRGWWLAWRLPALPRASAIYDRILALVEAFGDLLLRSQNGKIRYYLVVILGAVVILLAIGIVSILPVAIQPVVFRSASDLLKAVLLVLSLIATVASVIFRRHLLAALSLGMAGYAIGGVFLLEPAPDVALVQFLVETLGTVLIILILARTSEEERRQAMAVVWGQSRPGLWRDALIATAMGVLMTIFALAAVNNRPNTNTIANWHLENAYEAVGVTDVVAGIITDFRGTDTLIEITVFSMAALGVLTLLARPKAGRITPLLPRRRAEPQTTAPADDEPELPDVYTARFTNPVTQLAAELVLPFSILIAIAHIAYAGVAPGDGFTAGVIIGLGVALWYVVFGYDEARRRLKWLRPTPLIGIGLTLAIANAIAPLLFGREFFAFTRLTTFSIADIKLASTTIFEIGICLSVFGGISTIMEAISHPKECEPL
jgi:NADH:ubiquinone oxidoreductase subunit 5 (subunit L)/multisubunit Na+/H+ antiporter MnhA subunit